MSLKFGMRKPGFGGHASREGVGGPQIVLSASSQTENTTIGTTIGTLSVVGGTGTWTFTKTADPDSAFTLTGGALKNAIVFNYETKTSYSVTIQATNGTLTINRTITISVGNVLETTLNALTIDDNTSVAGAAWSATITGKTSGSTITATSSDGTVLTVVGTTVSGTFALDGSPTVTLHETHPDAAPRDTGIAVTVAPGVPQIIVIVYGQSNANNLVGTPSASVPTAAARTYVWDPTTSAWLAAGDGASPLRDGAITILNSLRGQNPTKTVGMVYSSRSSTGSDQLMEGATGEADAGAWLTLKGRLTASGAASAEDHYILWRQGEAEGNSGSVNIALYRANLAAIHQSIADELGVSLAGVPFIVSSLAPLNDPTNVWAATAATWSAVNAALKGVEGVNTNQWFSHSNYDATLADEVHENGDSCARSGRRYAETILWLRGQAAHRPHWSITSLERATATTTPVQLAHSMGTDYLPTSGIGGFEVSADGSTWIAATGARTDADTITLTHSALGATSADNRYARYQYMADYADENIHPVVYDNSALAVPLTMSAGDLLVDYALPVMTSSSAFNVADGETYVETLTVSRPSTYAIGGVDAAFFHIVAGVLEFINPPAYSAPADAGANNVYNITITPTAIDNGDVGTAQSIAATVLAPVSKSKTYAGAVFTDDGWDFINGSVDIGADGAGRLIVAGITCSSEQPTPPTVKVAGQTLALVASSEISNNYYAAFYTGVVTGSGIQAVDVLFNPGAYRQKSAEVWALRGLTSGTPAAASGTASSDGFTSIAVVAADYLLALRLRGGNEGLGGGPTQAPDRSGSLGSSGFRPFSADWTIASSSGAFDLGLDAATSVTSYARFA